MIYIAFALLVVFLLAGLPIALSLAGAGLVGLWALLGDWSFVVGLVGPVLYSTVADYTLTTIPMFILMAYLISGSGIAQGMFDAMAAWLSPLRGGLCYALIGTTSLFGAMCGSSVAAGAVMSEIAAKEMRRKGYADELIGGAVSVGATTNVLIPPSIGMVIYGLITDTSVGQLLVAGILPGIILAVVLAGVTAIWMAVNPALAPHGYSLPWRTKFSGLSRIWPCLLLIAAIMMLLYSGLATPTEVGAAGAFGAAIIGFAIGDLSLRKSLVALKLTLKSTAMIFAILIGAKIFGIFLTLTQIPQHFVDWVTFLDVNRWVIIVGIIACYFIISMLMDELPLMMITLPLTFPVVIALGFDPVWYGVLNMLMVAMGLVFPPVGMVAFVVADAARIDLVKVYKGCTVLISAIFITTILVMIFPQIALFLPNAMRG